MIFFGFKKIAYGIQILLNSLNTLLQSAFEQEAQEIIDQSFDIYYSWRKFLYHESQHLEQQTYYPELLKTIHQEQYKIIYRCINKYKTSNNDNKYLYRLSSFVYSWYFDIAISKFMQKPKNFNEQAQVSYDQSFVQYVQLIIDNDLYNIWYQLL